MQTRQRPRSSPRVDVSYDAVLVMSDGYEVKVVIKDLSASGFRIELSDEVLAGDEVRLRTSKGGDMHTRIVWSLGSEAGGLFLDKAAVC